MNNIDKIIEIIRDAMDTFLDDDIEITADMDLVTDLHADSLDKVLIIGNIEEEFGVDIKNDDFSNIRTVADIDKKISEKLKRG